MILMTGASGRIAARTAEFLAGQGVPLRLVSRTPQPVPKIAGVQAVAVAAKAPPGERALMRKEAIAAGAQSLVTDSYGNLVGGIRG